MGSEDRQRESIDDLDALLTSLPPEIVDAVHALPDRTALIEVVMDLGRRPEARFPDSEVTLLEREIAEADIAFVVEHIGTFGDDNRAGIERTLHRISAIRNRNGKIVGLTCRIGRAVYGTIEIINDFVETGKSILIMGRPGIGKTTMLREAARVLADDMGKRVVVVDTSNEIAGDGDIPHPAIGKARRMQVRTPSLQHEVMIEAVENHMPQVIVIDEIGTELEAQAARTIAERGVQLIGTAHGNNLDNLMLNPTLSDLIGGIQSVTLGDEEARRRRTQKSVLERKAPPTFDVIVEIEDRERVAVHADVADTIDAMLRGDPVAPELRWRDEEGVHRSQGRPRPSPARAARRGAVRRPRRRRLAVADGARLARRRARTATGGYREAERGGGSDPGYRPGASGGWRQTRGGSGREPRHARPRIGGWRTGHRCPVNGSRRRPARPASRRRRSSPATSPIAGPLERGAADRGRRPAPGRRASSSARRPGATRPARPCRRHEGGGGDRAGQRRRPRGGRRPRRAAARRRGGPRRRARCSCPAARRCRPCACCPRASAASASSRRSATCSLPVVIARDVDEADVVMTLRNEYKQKTPLLREAEERAMPIYVLKSNTIPQMQSSLTSIFSLEIDPREAAMRETEDAIEVGAVVVRGRSSCRRRTPTSGGSSTRWPSGRTSSRGRAAASRTVGSGSTRTPRAAAGGDADGSTVDFIGHSALVDRARRDPLLTDPVTRARIGPLRRVEPVPRRDRLRDIDAVLISHLHWDHLDVPSLRDLGRDVADLRPGRRRAMAARLGFRDVRELAVGGRDIGRRGRVRGVAGRPLRVPAAARPDRAAARVRRPRQPTVYFAGDTDLFDGMARAGRADRPRAAPVWGWGPTLGRGLHLDPLGRPGHCACIRPRRGADPLGDILAARAGSGLPERLVEPPAAFVEYAAELAPAVQTIPTAVGDAMEWDRDR